MIRPRPSLLALTRLVYADLARTLRSLWRLVLVAGLISLGVLLVEHFALRFVPGPASARELIGLILGLATTALLVPFMVTVHRFILRQEVTNRYFEPANRERAAVITTWLLAYTCLTSAPSFLRASLGGSTADHVFIDGLVALALLILSLRLIILVPALAVDAPGATWRNTLADTYGHAWYILGAVLIAFLPFVLVSLALWGAGRADGASVITSGQIAMSLLTTLELPFGVIVLSRLYEILGDRVDQPLQTAV
jgi:hypothetical protein